MVELRQKILDMMLMLKEVILITPYLKNGDVINVQKGAIIKLMKL